MAPVTSPMVRSSGNISALGPDAVAVFLGRSLTFAEMEVWADGHIAVMGELAGDLLGRLIPAGHVTHDIQ